MNLPVLRVLLIAVSTLTASLAVADPQYTLIDLGSTQVAGAGLMWAPHTATPAGPPNFQVLYYPAAGADYEYALYAVYDANGEFLSALAAGQAGTQSNSIHAVQWSFNGCDTCSTIVDLGVLPGALPDAAHANSIAYNLNTVGDIVGASDSATVYFGSTRPARHAFLYNNGTMTDLGSLAGPAYDSQAVAINYSHETVGWTNTISSATGEVLKRAFVYIDGTMYNVSFFITGGPAVRLTEARWIDCQGNIGAIGALATGGSFHSYLLVPQGPPRTCPN